MINTFDIFGSRSGKWKTVRKNHLINNPECAACGRKNNLEVHHIEPYQLNPERELDPTNLITLCDDYCHFVFGHLMDYRSWNVNVVEDCKRYKEQIDNKPHTFSQPIQRGYLYEALSSLINTVYSFIRHFTGWNY